MSSRAIWQHPLPENEKVGHGHHEHVSKSGVPSISVSPSVSPVRFRSSSITSGGSAARDGPRTLRVSIMGGEELVLWVVKSRTLRVSIMGGEELAESLRG